MNCNLSRVLFVIIGGYLLLVLGCQKETAPADEEKPIFEIIPSRKTNVHFTNSINSSNAFNFLNYPYIYNGGGVAIGDINNDGLDDIYFSSNQNSNKLYLNKGDCEFKDITEEAGVSDSEGWTTGVSMIDINNDGFLDIYVCKSGKYDKPSQRANKLYLNTQNKSFTEAAVQWRLADTGFSTQAYFLDYDKDGDLDMYLVNHRPDFGNLKSTSVIIQEASDQLYRNDGEFFTNVSEESGIQNKAWGLSAAIADFNNDSWPDVYVCNDFSEPDFLYINNQKGGFEDQILDRMDHISLNSMGSDIADFDNDGLLDLMVLDMSAEDHVRSKTNMPSMSTEAFEEAVRKGNHHQYMFNMLHWNRGKAGFSEMAQMAGVSKTDWSWAPLFADFDNDGLKDLLVTNGIKKDVGNVDFRNSLEKRIQAKEQMSLEGVLNMVPGNRLANYIFRNNGNLTFSKKTTPWGLTQPSFSNGAAYGDLDNDGDLDVVINNLDDEAFIYQNESSENYIQFKFEGPAKNSFGIGAKVKLKYGNEEQIQVLYAARGFQSSVSPKLHFGLANIAKIDEVLVFWPDGKTQKLANVDANQLMTIGYNASSQKLEENHSELPIKEILPMHIGIDYVHKEIPFDDYQRQLLLPYKLSQNGPYIAVSDINNDNLDDFYIGGASGQSGVLYLQTNEGTFIKSIQDSFEKDKIYEDLEVLFFDFDNDRDSDLFVVSGGNEFESESKMYQNRLYENIGNGKFISATHRLPKDYTSGQSVAVSDIDNDGDLDLFVGGRHIPGKYPSPPKSSLLLNENGYFKNVTHEQLPNEELGMVTDAIFSDYDNDGDNDLLVVGEWMNIELLSNQKGHFTKKTIASLNNTNGLWFSIAAEDIDNDGDDDYFVGNIGTNTKFKVDENHSFQVLGNDFDDSGTQDVVLVNNYKNRLVPLRGKQCSSEQTPFIAKKFSSFADFANASIYDIYGTDKIESAVHYEANILESVFLENLGNGSFSLQKLPNEAQLSPITDFRFVDIDKDGRKEVFSVGNLFPVEVETIRLDASKGAVLSYENQTFTNFKNSGFMTRGDARRFQTVKTSEGELFIVVRNDSNLQVLKIK